VEVTLELRGGGGAWGGGGVLGAATTSNGSAQDTTASAGGAFAPSSHWKFVLFRPSADHVAAACVEGPTAWPPLGGSGGGTGHQGGGIAMWQCVPLHWERPMAPALLGCSR
jgi:hypothetical protein